MNINTREWLIKNFFLIMAFSSIIFLLGIVIVLFSEGLPLFSVVGVGELIFGTEWYPAYYPADYGIFPLILGSLWVTGGAMLLAVPLGISSAVFISKIAPGYLKEVIKPIIELLAAIPSVVYGLFGMQLISPLVMRIFQIPTGLTAFTAALVLGFMALPTIVSIAEDALSSVPSEYQEASLALGANKWETIRLVVLPASISGIVTACILGMGRAIGETMTVLMVSGAAAVIPRTLLQPVRPMTAAIAAEMGEVAMGSTHYHALFAIGIVLFLFTLLFNIIADYSQQKFKERIEGK